MKKLAIIGPGLLGGSIALALQHQPGWRVALWARRPEAVAELQALGIAHESSTDLRSIAEGADMVVFCTPIGVMAALAQQVVEVLPPHALVTDVGSVKASVVTALEPIFAGRVRFVGSHPMAGSDRTGIAAARANLFAGSVCMVTPTPAVAPETVAEVSAFWEALGCRVSQLAPAAHDEAVALVSHLTHVAAAALVNAVQGRAPEAFAFSGPGFRDTTRVASGSPTMWTEILTENSAAVRGATEAMIVKLQEFVTLLDSATSGETARMTEFLTQAKLVRDQLRLPPLP